LFVDIIYGTHIAITRVDIPIFPPRRSPTFTFNKHVE